MKAYDSKRQQIKEAGIKSFAIYGYHKTTLEDIAGMLNMKKNSLYYYFDSKDALFKEIIEDTVAEHFKNVEKIINSDDTAANKISKIIECLDDFIAERTIGYAIKVSSYIEISRVIKRTFPESHNMEVQMISKILKEGIDSGELVNHDYKTLAKDIAEIIHAIFNFHYVNADTEFIRDVDIKPIIAQTKRYISYILNGIKNN